MNFVNTTGNWEIFAMSEWNHNQIVASKTNLWIPELFAERIWIGKMYKVEKINKINQLKNIGMNMNS